MRFSMDVLELRFPLSVLVVEALGQEVERSIDDPFPRARLEELQASLATELVSLLRRHAARSIKQVHLGGDNHSRDGRVGPGVLQLGVPVFKVAKAFRVRHIVDQHHGVRVLPVRPQHVLANSEAATVHNVQFHDDVGVWYTHPFDEEVDADRHVVVLRKALRATLENLCQGGLSGRRVSQKNHFAPQDQGRRLDK
eukprot:CAMPEP_0181470156 /NCGR_PEP_ID=MMETSP1110-20121109/38404_1 /TAXON_ID=174948 /ORGANISM="Symbiodinium sp., Strain CCMP421" /LENGTH=195 /DNA_ID=CAMNT_0023595115 /DNA_START=43 /DNA_END=630 /DNA_ORIENTATION=+